MHRVLLFAKRPRPGKVKTRLTPPLSAEQAAEVYRAFLADLSRMLQSLSANYSVEWYWDDAPTTDDARELTLDGFELHQQGAGDLGQRLRRAFGRLDRPTLVIGGDCPTVSIDDVHQAFEALEQERSVVIKPAEDGGYLLIGSHRYASSLFTDIDWGSERVFEQTRERLIQAGLELHLLRPSFDVDTVDDLHRLARLSSPPLPVTKETLSRLGF